MLKRNKNKLALSPRKWKELQRREEGEEGGSSRNPNVGISWELAIISISDAEEHFVCEVDLKYTWFAKGWVEDYEAAGQPLRGGDEFRRLVDNCWDPLVHIYNAVNLPDEVSKFTFCLDAATGQMHRFHKLRAACSENLELHFFPFDRQWLAVQIATFHDISDVVFVPYTGRICFNRSRASRWHLRHQTDPLLVIPDTQSHGLLASSGRLYHKCYITSEAVRDFWW
jgi:hypothetical protein